MTDKKPQRTGGEKGMNLAREKSMKTFEELYAEPPPYTVSAQQAGSVPATEELNFQPSPLEIPTPAECIAHLKLLHAFAKLRHDVGNCDGLFGISTEKMDAAELPANLNGAGGTSGSLQAGGVHERDPAQAAVEAHAPGDAMAALAERIRDKRWTIFVTKAVDRYEKWWATHSNQSTEWTYSSIKKTDFEGTARSKSPYENSGDEAHSDVVSIFPVEGLGYDCQIQSKLPPLDVLMVWHAHMLNPRIYLEDSIRYTNHTLWRTRFPWEAVYASINNATFEYTQEDMTTFKQSTGEEWDSLRERDFKEIRCPKCVTANNVPWTQPPPVSAPEALEAYLTGDTGFAGSAFQHNCTSCDLTITHEKLRVGKFCDDGDALVRLQRPLAGTILNIWGEPTGT
jgi:hypothetical protein